MLGGLPPSLPSSRALTRWLSASWLPLPFPSYRAPLGPELSSLPLDASLGRWSSEASSSGGGTAELEELLTFGLRRQTDVCL